MCWIQPCLVGYHSAYLTFLCLCDIQDILPLLFLPHQDLVYLQAFCSQKGSHSVHPLKTAHESVYSHTSLRLSFSLLSISEIVTNTLTWAQPFPSLKTLSLVSICTGYHSVFPCLPFVPGRGVYKPNIPHFFLEWRGILYKRSSNLG